MSYELLPYLRYGTYVTAFDAKQDKLDIVFGGWEHVGTEATAGIIANHLAQTEHVIADGQARRVFLNQHRLPYGACFENTFRRDARSGRRAQRARNEYGTPLLSGSIRHLCQNPGSNHPETGEANPSDFGASQYNIVAELALNPTRSFNHYSRQQMIALPQNAEAFPDAPLFSTRDAHTCGYEHALDNNDNVIVHPAHGRKTTPAIWPRFRRHMLQGVDDYLTALIDAGTAVCGLDGQPTTRHATYQIRYTETFWEFQDHDPIGLVHSLRPRIRAIGTFVRETEHLDDEMRIQETQHQNAVSYRVALANGIELAVYAKTNRRIRLEVRHTMNRLSSRIDGLPTSFACFSIEHVDQVLEQVAVSAQNRLNRVIDLLTSELDEGPRNFSKYDLITEIVNACNQSVSNRNWVGARHRNAGQTAYQTIISSLINRNSYRVADGDPYREIMRRLRRRNVVLNEGWGGRTYRLADEYQRARLELAPSSHCRD